MRNAVEIVTRLNLKNETLSWATDVIARQLEHLVRLVDDLLDISRISGGKIQVRKELIDAATAVARAAETSRPLIDARHHAFQLTLPAEPVWVNADPVRLAQVLANLLNNAAKYTEEGGKISVELAASTTRPSFGCATTASASRERSCRPFSSCSLRLISRLTAPTAASASD